MAARLAHVRSIVLQNPRGHAMALARQAGCSESTINAIRAELTRAGLIQRCIPNTNGIYPEERARIEALLLQGMRATEVGRIVGRHGKTIQNIHAALVAAGDLLPRVSRRKIAQVEAPEAEPEQRGGGAVIPVAAPAPTPISPMVASLMAKGLSRHVAERNAALWRDRSVRVVHVQHGAW